MVISAQEVTCIADELLKAKYSQVVIGGRIVELNVPSINMIFDKEEVFNQAKNLAMDSPPGTQVSVVIEYGDYGGMQGELRSRSSPGFAGNY